MKKIGNTAESFGPRPTLPKKRPAETPEATVSIAIRKFFVEIIGRRGMRRAIRYEAMRLREYSNLDIGFLSSKTAFSKAVEHRGKARMKRKRAYVIAGVLE